MLQHSENFSLLIDYLWRARTEGVLLFKSFYMKICPNSHFSVKFLSKVQFSKADDCCFHMASVFCFFFFAWWRVVLNYFNRKMLLRVCTFGSVYKLELRKNFDFRLLTDLHFLVCPEHDLTIFRKCLSVCMYL